MKMQELSKCSIEIVNKHLKITCSLLINEILIQKETVYFQGQIPKTKTCKKITQA